MNLTKAITTRKAVIAMKPVSKSKVPTFTMSEARYKELRDRHSYPFTYEDMLYEAATGRQLKSGYGVEFTYNEVELTSTIALYEYNRAGKSVRAYGTLPDEESEHNYTTKDKDTDMRKISEVEYDKDTIDAMMETLLQKKAELDAMEKRWKTEGDFNEGDVIVIEYAYSDDVDAKVYTCAVVKTKAGWFTTLTNVILGGVKYSEIVKFFEKLYVRRVAYLAISEGVEMFSNIKDEEDVNGNDRTYPCCACCDANPHNNAADDAHTGACELCQPDLDVIQAAANEAASRLGDRTTGA